MTQVKRLQARTVPRWVLLTASCNHGWLRRVVEGTFALLIAASFILILAMSLNNKPGPALETHSKCQVVGCRVVCKDVHFEDENQHDIMTNALKIAEGACERVVLTLRRPMFINSTMPKYWLSGTRSNVVELAIIAGNLRHITPQAFMTQFGSHVECLILENVTVSRLVPETLVGLTTINNVYIKNTTLGTIKSNSLGAVDDTLKVLTVIESGEWDPRNLTGSSDLIKLVTVDFSSNYFGDVIGKESFTRLSYCRVLFLNSCGIKTLGLGAFDYMPQIEVIYLNNNNLKRLSPGLFDKVIAFPSNHKPRVSLQDNPWFCHCSHTALRRLTSNGMLLVDITCHHPNDRRGVYFSEIEKHCRKNENDRSNIADGKPEKININGSCPFKNYSAGIVWNYPIVSLPCSIEITRSFQIPEVTYISEYDQSNTKNILIPYFALEYGNFSMVEITSQGPPGYGLLWYQSKCPGEVYCVQTLPTSLRIYNVEERSKYTFCPLQLSSGKIEKCISYSLDSQLIRLKKFKVVFSVSLGLSCLICGALMVYALIRRYPTLLKGNDRILFVKHKSVGALILPPKVPLRTNERLELWPNSLDDEIFVINNTTKCVPANKFLRTMSIKSGKSISPTYVSAMEPTEDQLAEWRLNHHFNKVSTATPTLTLDVSTYSRNSDNRSLYEYYSVCKEPNIYESLN